MAFQLDDLNDDLAPKLAASVAKVQEAKTEAPKAVAVNTPAISAGGVPINRPRAAEVAVQNWPKADPVVLREELSALIDDEDEPEEYTEKLRLETLRLEAPPAELAPLPETPTVVAAAKRRRRTKAQMAEAKAAPPPSQDSELVEELATLVQGLKDYSDRTISDLDKVLARLRISHE